MPDPWQRLITGMNICLKEKKYRMLTRKSCSKDMSRNKINSDAVLYYVGIAQLTNQWIMVENYY